MKFSTAVSVAVFASGALAFPSFHPADMKRSLDSLGNGGFNQFRGLENVDLNHPNCSQPQTARLFVVPDPPTDTNSKKIPDEDHPYVAPGPNDTRGPCPMLNTLANHGYVDHSGVDTSENIIKAVREGGNMEHVFAAFVVSFATMARGNPNTAMLSIGFESEKVPVTPGCPDGLAPPGGLAKHGRFEGDVSSTRTDIHVGDHVNVNATQFNQLLGYVAQYGDDGPEGPRTVVNVAAFKEFKYDRFNEDAADDARIDFLPGRQLTTYTEVAFILELMQDGRYNQTSTRQLTNFFMNQTFGDDFHRRQGPAGAAILGMTSAKVREAHPIPFGKADENGTYVITTPAFTNFNCAGYYDLATEQLPAAYNQSTGILRRNIETMSAAMFRPFHETAGCETMGFPSGPAGM